MPAIMAGCVKYQNIFFPSPSRGFKLLPQNPIPNPRRPHSSPLLFKSPLLSSLLAATAYLPPPQEASRRFRRLRRGRLSVSSPLPSSPVSIRSRFDPSLPSPPTLAAVEIPAARSPPGPPSRWIGVFAVDFSFHAKCGGPWLGLVPNGGARGLIRGHCTAASCAAQIQSSHLLGIFMN